MDKKPLQAQAEKLASHGRYGDTMLVHMHPAEVAGIAALTPGGLTRNPVTGQPEAFAFLLPMLASGIGSALGWGTLGSALLAGGMTAAVTGDLKRGIAAGLMGAGIGSALGAAGKAGAEATAEQAAQAVIPEASQPILEQTALAEAQKAAASTAMTPDITPPLAAVQPPFVTQMTTNPTMLQALNTPGQTGADLWGSMTPWERTKSMFGTEAGRDALLPALTKPANLLPIAMGGGQLENLQAQEDWQKEMDRLAGKSKEQQRQIYDQLQGAYAAAQPYAMRGYNPYRNRLSSNLPGPWTPPGYATGGSVTTSNITYGPYGAGIPTGYTGYGGIDPVTIQQNLGGQSVAPPPGFVPGFNPEMDYFQNLTSGQQPQYPAFTSPQQSSQALYAGSPINRFLQHQMPAPYYRQPALPVATMGPQPAPTRDTVTPTPPTSAPPPTLPPAPAPGSPSQPPNYYAPYNPYRPYRPRYGKAEGGAVDVGKEAWRRRQEESRRDEKAGRPYWVGNTPDGQDLYAIDPGVSADGYESAGYLDVGINAAGGRITKHVFIRKAKGKADGGSIPLNTAGGQMSVAPGGIASVPNGYTGPSQQDVEMLRAALTGNLPEPQISAVVEGFVRKYGPDVFRQVREAILQAQVPNAQTEGKVQGMGSGTGDQVPGMIGNQQPVAVSPGEYIVPADVVSGLGNGSTDAGAAQLDKMMGNVRQARGGGRTQPPDINPRALMPA